MRRLGSVTDFSVGVDGNSQIFIQAVYGDSNQKIGITFSNDGKYTYW